MNQRDYHEWFENVDLGSLEDVRWYVNIHALQNCGSDWSCAKATVELYIDDPEMAEVFEGYRVKQILSIN